MDWMLVVVTLLLGAIGVVNLYSAAAHMDSSPPVYIKQMVFLGIGFLLGGIVALLDYRRWLEYWWILYGLTLVGLAAVLVVGKSVSGSHRWLDLGPINIQPSELAKWVVLILIARHLQKRPSLTGDYTLRDLAVPLILVAPIAALVAMEPDLGTTVILMLIVFTVLIFAGLRWRSFLWLVLAGVAALPLFWSVLEDYQRDRILCFIDPARDPLGAGYHLVQSKIAVGSGGFLGKGFREGTQSHLRFLPEHHTDFAFSVWAEEWGFVGAVVVLGLFFLLLAYGLYVAYKAEDQAGRALAFGVVSFLFWPVFVNLGMTLGLLPVVGVALPFISYGGSALVTSMMALALLQNIRLRRFMFQ